MIFLIVRRKKTEIHFVVKSIQPQISLVRHTIHTGTIRRLKAVYFLLLVIFIKVIKNLLP